jgi:hypothetical protein
MNVVYDKEKSARGSKMGIEHTGDFHNYFTSCPTQLAEILRAEILRARPRTRKHADSRNITHIRGPRPY